MSKEYIEREAAVAALKGLPFQWDVEDLAVYEAIEEVPNADVAPVVHCCKCEHWARVDIHGFCYKHKIYMNAHDFCSYGIDKTKELP